MGKAAPAGVEQAQQVITGTITAVGPTAWLLLRGNFNISVWGSVNTTLTTTSGSSSATVASATGLFAGQGINSVNVPAGTTIGSIASTTVTLAFPPGITNAQVTTGADTAALFGPADTQATVQVERSFDGGMTPLIYGSTGAQFINPTSASLIFTDPEKGVLWRLNCTLYTSGTVNYRISSGSYDTPVSFPGT